MRAGRAAGLLLGGKLTGGGGVGLADTGLRHRVQDRGRGQRGRQLVRVGLGGAGEAVGGRPGRKRCGYRRGRDDLPGPAGRPAPNRDPPARVPSGGLSGGVAAVVDPVVAGAVSPVTCAQKIPNAVLRPATRSRLRPLAGPDKIARPSGLQLSNIQMSRFWTYSSRGLDGTETSLECACSSGSPADTRFASSSLASTARLRRATNPPNGLIDS